MTNNVGIANNSRRIEYLSMPQALANARKDLQSYEDISYSDCPYEAAQDAEAILILTDWKFFRDLDYDRIYQSMKKPAFIFDGRNILDHKELEKIGFHLSAIGKA